MDGSEKERGMDLRRNMDWSKNEGHSTHLDSNSRPNGTDFAGSHQQEYQVARTAMIYKNDSRNLKIKPLHQPNKILIILNNHSIS